MRVRSLCLLLLALVFQPVAHADSPRVAMTQATEADGEPLPRPTIGPAVETGPTLPFSVAIDFRCPAGTQRQLLFLSIANTTRLEDVTGSQPPRIERLDVPLRQVEWLTEPANSCAALHDGRRPDEVAGDGTRYYRLAARADGYATLTCEAEGGQQSAMTSSAPLDVWLACPVPVEPPAP
jgi:hypothetical protein